METKGTNNKKEVIEETADKEIDTKIKKEITDPTNDNKSIEDASEKEEPHGEYKRISAHPDFICVAQFIGTFGSFLGIPQFFIDTIEDGLNSSTSKIDDDSYLDGELLRTVKLS